MDAGGGGGVAGRVPAVLFPPQPPEAAGTPSRPQHHASTLGVTSLPILVLTVLGILTTSALLLTYYVFVIRCCLTWHASSSTSAPGGGGGDSASLVISLSRRRRRRGRAAAAADASDDLPVVYGGAPGEARGLDGPAIQALPAFSYRKAATFAAGECAVCLGEFQEEERLRLLPSCLHVFHLDCIDTWLHGNAHCPLCRAAAATHLPPLMHRQLQRPEEEDEEVVIQVQVAGD